MIEGKGIVTEVSIKNNPGYLSRLRLIIGCHADCAGMNRKETYDAKIAVTEACTNAIRHGGSDCDKDRITIRVSSAGGAVEAEVTDLGEGFDPTEIVARQRTEPGGYGIPLMRKLTDEIEFLRNGRSMTVRILKRASSGRRNRHPRTRG